MRARLLLGASLTVSLLATSVAAAHADDQAGQPTAPPETGTAGASAPIALTGGLPRGVAVHSADVFALDHHEELSPGQSIGRSLVASHLDRSDDGYIVGIEPSSVPASAIYAGGVVDFEVNLYSDASTWTTFASARMVMTLDKNVAEWVDAAEALPEDGQTLKAVGRAGDVARTRVPLISSRHDLSVPYVDAQDLYESGATSDTERAAAAASPCDWQYLSDSNRSTTIATSYPKGTSNSWLDVDYSQGGTFGIAVSTASGYTTGGTGYAGGGWGATWPKSSDARSYRIGVNYHKYRGGCTGVIRWAPHVETGGATSNTSGVTRPDWNTYCSNVAKGVTWRRYLTTGSSYNYGQAVKFAGVIGIDLSAKKDYSSHHTLYYEIKGSNPKKLCGNNDYPSLAGKIIERKR